ncbi:MAG: type II toxin-antitoxin system RelE/ParE family toxin [Myxococcales bacterium]|nr:MAG: type II toxin-antitoxin system RelE/ParE family toxin [Myxococcales bacterium]
MTTTYRIQLARSAVKEYHELPDHIQARVRKTIDAMASEPRPAGKCVKIANAINRWRIRVGDYRIVYDVDDSARVVDIIRIRHRKDVYRG